jgi:Ca2+/Na+ antiporter
MIAPQQGVSRTAFRRLVGIGLAAVVVTVVLIVIGRVHKANYYFSLFGANPIDAIRRKSLLATIVLIAAGVQVLLALWIYRKLPLAGAAPRPVRLGHRVLGAAIFLLTVPIAIHCLIAYGVRFDTARRAVHSLAGCFFYGAFTAKVLIVRSKRLPGWVLPVAGGTLAVLIVVLWYTSALYYYHNFSLPGF